MTPLHRSVPQRRRRNLTPSRHFLLSLLAFAIGLSPAALVIGVMHVLNQPQPSRLQPALDQIQRFGERKCWSGEAAR